LGMIPGVKPGQLKDVNVDEHQFVLMEAIVSSMTPEEREKPEIINFSRKKRRIVCSLIKHYKEKRRT